LERGQVARESDDRHTVSPVRRDLKIETDVIQSVSIREGLARDRARIEDEDA
jgi:hypothetical protein